MAHFFCIFILFHMSVTFFRKEFPFNISIESMRRVISYDQSNKESFFIRSASALSLRCLFARFY